MADNESIIVDPPDEQASYPDIYLIQEGDEVQGGEEGISNKQAIGLVKRTHWLRVLLIQLLGMLGKLTSQTVFSELIAEGGQMGTILGETGASIAVQRTPDNKFAASVVCYSDVTANIYIKHFTSNGVVLHTMQNVALSSAIGNVSILPDGGVFGDYVEGEINIGLKSAEFKIRTSADALTNMVWTRGL